MTKARDLANIISGGFDATDIPNLDTAKITSGTFVDARLPATALNSNVDLTNLSASNMTSGTLPDARFPATLPAVSGANLTGISSDFVRLGYATSGYANTISVDYFTSTYEIYKVFVEGVRCSNNGQVYGFRFNTSSGTAQTGSNYKGIFTGGYRNNSGTTGTAQGTSNWNNDMMNLSNGSPQSYEMGSHEITVYLPTESDTRTRCIVTGGGFDANHIYSRHGHGVYSNAETHTGLTFLATAGTIAIDHIEVYGIK